jgi:hypothetical protein
MSKIQDKITQLEEEGKLLPSYKFNEPIGSKKGVTDYVIDVSWHAYYGATGYRVYRSVNGAAYTLVLDWEAPLGYDWYGFYDNDVAPGSTYTYYVTAYGDFGETAPSQIVTRDTWLHPCSLDSPIDGLAITDPNPTFTWNPVGVSSFPYGPIYSGESDLWVYDDTAGETVLYTWFDNMTTSTATYNQDGQASPLVACHGYYWDSWGYGIDGNGNLIAISESEDWYFSYGPITPPEPTD